MLHRLLIKNLVLVESSEVTFQPGFTAITGETGAGKSILLSSLSLLLGGRLDSSLIRQGASSSIVEATFSVPKILPELDLAGISYDESGEVTIRRELLASGKSRAFINDQAVQLTLLKKLSGYLIEVSAQHAHIELTQQGAPLDILDSFAANFDLLASFQASYKELLSLMKAKTDFIALQQERMRKMQAAQREIEEIDSIEPHEGEDDSLYSEYSQLAKATESSEEISKILAIMDGQDGSCLSQLGGCKSHFDKLIQKNDALKEQQESFKSAFSTLQDVAFELTKLLESSQDAQIRYQEIDDRLKKLHELKKKYGPTLSEVISWKESQKNHLKKLECASFSEDELDEKLALCKKEVDGLAKKLTDARQIAAKSFSCGVTQELQQLNMPSALFEVELAAQTRSHLGDEAIHFFLTPNRGEPRVLVQNGASGGELARLSLAIKCQMMDKNPVGTILFDEIDANIGGETATVVGKKLVELGKCCQVLTVTHFPQVAMHADSHFSIEKQETEGRTTSRIRLLSTEAERHAELNRMVGGIHIPK